MSEKYFPPDRLLELSINGLVQLYAEDDSFHFTVRLVGADNKHSVMVTLPPKSLLPEGKGYTDIFSRGLTLEMRTVHEGHVVAFESSVKSIYERRLLIGSFPEMIETRRLRRDSRYPCTLSCDIQVGDNNSYGVITDISNGGCQLTVEKNQDYSSIEQSIGSEEPMCLKVFFPGLEDPVQIMATAKSAACQIEGSCRVGLSFGQYNSAVQAYMDSLELDSITSFFH